MRSFLKKTAALLLVMVLGVVSPVQGNVNVRADETATTAATQVGKDFLQKVIGEYQPLFEGASFEAKYDHYWHDYSAAVVGESMADMCVAMMKQAIGAKTYGDEAGEEFFCGFIADVVKIEFGGEDGSKVTFTKKDGTKISHKYSYVKDAAATGSVEGQEMKMDGYLYKSTDDNKDEFTYLYMCPDTIDTTYHLEFRYGSSEEDILKLTEGKYKNWLIAAFPVSALEDPNEILMQKVIALFVLENVGAMSGEEAASQRASMSGIWDMDVTAFKNYPGYENASMNMQLSKAGNGKSYVDMTGTGAFMLASEYPFYIYATDKKDNVESGVYIVESEDEGVKTAAYEIAENDGKRVLTFSSPEGVIKYYYRCGLTPGSVSISKAKVKGSKKLVLSWNSVENADGYVILLSSNSKFKKARTVTVEGKTSAKLKKLKKKTYYVKVCAYIEDYSGEKVFGEYSDVKEIEVK